MQANKKTNIHSFCSTFKIALLRGAITTNGIVNVGSEKFSNEIKLYDVLLFFRELSSTSICVRILQQIVFENCFVTKLDKSICQTANVIKILVMTETYFNSRGETIPQYFITLLNIEHLKWCFDYCLKGTNSKNFGIRKKEKHSEFGGLNVLSQTCVQLNC